MKLKHIEFSEPIKMVFFFSTLETSCLLPLRLVRSIFGHYCLVGCSCGWSRIYFLGISACESILSLWPLIGSFILILYERPWNIKTVSSFSFQPYISHPFFFPVLKYWRMALVNENHLESHLNVSQGASAREWLLLGSFGAQITGTFSHWVSIRCSRHAMMWSEDSGMYVKMFPRGVTVWRRQVYDRWWPWSSMKMWNGIPESWLMLLGEMKKKLQKRWH